MPTQPYFTKDRERVPSVTTVLGRFKESGGLLQWAAGVGYEQGRQGVALDLYAKRDEAGDIGTLVHALVEADIRGRPHLEVPVAFESAVVSAYSAWRDWWQAQAFTIDHPELALVSERHRFGGTIDAVGRDRNGRRVLLDWKTSNAVYVDYLVQIAAYGLLWDEHHPDDPIAGGFHLVRFSKTAGDFAHHYFPALPEGAEQFLLLRRAYELDKGLKKRAA